MNRAFDIAMEYLRDGRPPEQKNALTALRTIGSEESLRTLAECATENEADDLRRRALAELKQVPAERRPHVVHCLAQGLTTGRAASRSYAMLVELACAGFDTHDVRMTPWTHFRLAWRQFRERFGGWRRRPKRRLLLPGWIGALVAAVALPLYAVASGSAVASVDTMMTAVGELFAGSLLAAGPVWLLASQATPVSSYFQLGHGLLVESVRAWLWWLPFWAVVVLLIAEGGSSVVALSAVAVTPSVLVRAGTVLAAGLRRGRAGFAIQAVTGLGIALLAYTVPALSAWWVGEATTIGAFGYLWAFAVPLCAGLAVAYAQVDQEALPDDGAPPASERRTKAVLLIMACVALLIASPFLPSSLEGQREVITIDGAGGAGSQDIEVRTVPVHLTLEVRSQAHVTLSLPGIAESDRDFVLSLEGPLGSPDDPIRQDDPPVVEQDLKVGQYALEVTLYGESNVLNAGRLLDGLLRRSSGEQVDPPVPLAVTWTRAQGTN